MVTVPSRQAGDAGSQSLSRQVHSVGFYLLLLNLKGREGDL